ncbi:MAG: hypothetical protein M5U19_10085 [Microthrixaceae bacterium]|nr:hypothetical protein [Microthrixaceae bacterium]
MMNLVLLCRHHHGIVHRTGWTMNLNHPNSCHLEAPTSPVITATSRSPPPPEPNYRPNTAHDHPNRHPSGQHHPGDHPHPPERGTAVGRPTTSPTRPDEHPSRQAPDQTHGSGRRAK